MVFQQVEKRHQNTLDKFPFLMLPSWGSRVQKHFAAPHLQTGLAWLV